MQNCGEFNFPQQRSFHFCSESLSVIMKDTLSYRNFNLSQHNYMNMVRVPQLFSCFSIGVYNIKKSVLDINIKSYSSYKNKMTQLKSFLRNDFFY